MKQYKSPNGAREVEEILDKVYKMEEMTIIEVAILPDDVHMHVVILSKSSVPKVIERIKGKVH